LQLVEPIESPALQKTIELFNQQEFEAAVAALPDVREQGAEVAKAVVGLWLSGRLETEIEQQLKSDKVKVESVEAYTEDEKRHIVTKLTFKDINDLPEKWVFQDREMSFSSEGDFFTFRSVFSMGKDKNKTQGSEAQQGEDLGAFGEQFAEALFGDYTFTFSIEMPGQVVEASPEATIEQNTVVWEFSLAKLSDMKMIEMTVKARKPAAFPVLIIVILVVVIVAVIVIVMLMISRKKSK